MARLVESSLGQSAVSVCAPGLQARPGAELLDSQMRIIWDDLRGNLRGGRTDGRTTLGPVIVPHHMPNRERARGSQPNLAKSDKAKQYLSWTSFPLGVCGLQTAWAREHAGES